MASFCYKLVLSMYILAVLVVIRDDVQHDVGSSIGTDRTVLVGRATPSWRSDFDIDGDLLELRHDLHRMAPSRALAIPRLACQQCIRRHAQRRSFAGSVKLQDAGETRLPSVASPSFWKSLIPRPFRRPANATEAAERAVRRDAGAEERRTGIVFLILGILVGSNAINIIAIRREMLNFSRQTDAKLELLREVVQRVKNGEDVDVKRALGTGDPEQEREWEQVMKELEETDMLLENSKKREAKRAQKAEERKVRDENRKLSPTDATDGTPEPVKRPKFLM